MEYVEKNKMAHIAKCLSAFYQHYLAVTVGFCETLSCSSQGTDWMGYMKYLRSYTRKMEPDQFYTNSNCGVLIFIQHDFFSITDFECQPPGHHHGEQFVSKIHIF